ncbi:MAG: RIP metalloprotease RseP [Bryobacteraceae bacterium]
MEIFQDMFAVLAVLSAVVLVHELGHYWAARFFGVRVEVFSIGFGPRLFGFRSRSTEFRFAAVPLGGYVKMAGESGWDSAAAASESFAGKPRWQRFIIAFAGPFLTLALAVALLTGVFMVSYKQLPESVTRAVIGDVLPGSPAAQAGLRAGDRIIRLDGISNPTWEDVLRQEVTGVGRTLQVTALRGGRTFHAQVRPVAEGPAEIGSAGWFERSEVQVGRLVPGLPAAQAGLRRGDAVLSIDGAPVRSRARLHQLMRRNAGEPVTFTYQRDGRTETAVVRPVFTEIDGTARWMLGLGLEVRTVKTRLGPVDALRESISQNTRNAALIFRFFSGLVEGRLSAKALSGPIGMARISGDAARDGVQTLIIVTALIALNLAIVNLLPFPVLDGGAMAVLAVEMLLRRDLSYAVKRAMSHLGLAILAAFMAVVLYNDISRLLPFG